MEWEFSLHEIEKTAKSFWAAAGNARVIAFHGEMGAGKTTFIHALCDVKKVKDRVGSPTFALIHEYRCANNGPEKIIYHIDLYRLSDEAEAIAAGIEDCLYSPHICLVEWPEKIQALLPEGTLHAYLQIMNNQSRRLRLADK
jgi:tRNA threonylcarbamoyladenosine biosynthesis protein TsaE